MEHIFDPQSSTQFGWKRMAAQDGRRIFVLSYRVPKTKGYVIPEANRTTIVAFKGLVYADFETKAITRMEIQFLNFPATSDYRSLSLKVNYRPIRIAGQQVVRLLLF